MKRFLLLLVFWTLPAVAQNEFGPVESALFAREDDYFGFLHATVFRGFDPRLPMTFCALPSFGPEWGLSAWRGESGALQVYVSTAPQSLWHAGRFVGDSHVKTLTAEERQREVVPTIKVTNQHFELPQEIGDRVLSTWHRVLFNAMIRATAGGLDGVQFYYFANDARSGRFAAGKQWSPAPNTDAGRLAALASALRECSDGSAAHRDALMRALEAAESGFASRRAPTVAMEPHPVDRQDRSKDSSRTGFSFLRSKRSGSEILRLSQEELRRRQKPVPVEEPEVFLQTVWGRMRWCVTWTVRSPGHSEVFSVFVDDESGQTTYSGEPPNGPVAQGLP